MIVPIHALRNSAVRIGSGDLGQRISISTGDELEALGDQFNAMAARLQESYAGLKAKSRSAPTSSKAPTGQVALPRRRQP